MKKNIKSIKVDAEYPILYPKANAEREMLVVMLRKISPYVRFEEIGENGNMVTYRARLDLYEPKIKGD